MTAAKELYRVWVVQGTWEGGWWVDARTFLNHVDAVEYKRALDKGTPQETHRVVVRWLSEQVCDD